MFHKTTAVIVTGFLFFAQIAFAKESSAMKDCDACPELVVIPKGSFAMGSKPGTSAAPRLDEQPQHTVSLESFMMGKYEVTQEQWQAIMGTTPSFFKGATLPVESVSFNDIQKFLDKLSAKTGKKYRLPTEAEWEYTARANTKSDYAVGDDINKLKDTAWYLRNANEKTHPVGTKLPNQFGVHDMQGNVAEWTQDCWNKNHDGAPVDGSARLSGTCAIRVIRGGAWNYFPELLYSAHRFQSVADYRYYCFGFRVVREK